MKHIKTYKQFETQITPSDEDILQHTVDKQMELLNRDLTPEEFEILRKQIHNNLEDDKEIPPVNTFGEYTKGLLSKNPIGSTVSNTG